MPKYGEGKFWDNLKTKKEVPSLISYIRKSTAKGEIRTDGKYYYQFDKFHQEHKVHLHKYKREGKNARLIDEVDPRDGSSIKDIFKKEGSSPEPWF
ncbi:MAG: hypothetical protein LBS71_03020 [Puniceicoccales bacterium]|jgi:hypothetical protein|nr:hypothetical protein [Puniceicoccales bacterium]